MLSNPYNLNAASVLIIGEYASSKERKENESFNGSTGKYLLDNLRATGFNPEAIYFEPLLEKAPFKGEMQSLYVTKSTAKNQGISEYHGIYPTPLLKKRQQHIQALIRKLKPTLIISLGDVPMWAVAGITKESGTSPAPASAVTYNGSMLSWHSSNFMPLISPITVQRMWSLNVYFRHALHKASQYQTKLWKEPSYNFILQPGYAQTIATLDKLKKQLADDPDPLHLAVDLETRERHIACCGLAWSGLDAICIPFMRADTPCAYWTREQEYEIIRRLKDILTHPRCEVSGQNYEYDRQYIARYWGFRSNITFDTMTMHHTYQPDLKKGLDTLAFLYLDFYRYWKDESKNWDPRLGELQLWRYNCLDCVTTWAIAEYHRTQPIIHDPFYKFQMQMHEPVLDMTLRGTRCDLEEKARMTIEVKEKMKERAEWFEYLAGFNVRSKSDKPWWQSPAQTASLLYDVMKINPVMKKNSKGGYSRTADDNALATVAKREPLARKLCQKLQEYRSLSVFHNTFLTMELDHDNRIRCQYMLDGTKTFRFASMGDAFNYGTNLQNIPKGNE